MMKKNIKYLMIRLKCNITLPDIARLMGISRQALYRHLKDDNSCKLPTALKLEEITGINVKNKKETLKIGNQTYNKDEVEEALKNIKPIN